MYSMNRGWQTSDEPRATRELPPEVWLRILAYATHIPGALAHDDGETMVAFVRDKYGISLHRRHREATDLLLAASRVCKTWTPLVTEFLFQYIMVKSGDHAIEIANVLERYERDALNRNSAGRWTLRLELALEGVHRWGNEHALAVARIFVCCPNVSVFSTAFCTPDVGLYCDRHFVRVMRGVGTRLSLQRLELRGYATILEAILPPLAPTLEVLWLLPCQRAAQNGVLDPMHFPRMHTLVVADGFGWGGPPPTWTLPALATLCTEDNDYSLPSEQRLQRFFAAHGPQLHTLVASRTALSHLRACTSLVDWTLPCGLMFHIARVAPGGERRVLPATLRRLTLVDDMSTTYMLRLDHVALLVEWLGAGYFPVLETVRFLLPLGRHIRRQRLREDWECGVELLQVRAKQRNVRLEASIGGDDQAAGVWSVFSVDHLLDPGPGDVPPFSKQPFSAH
ncbi:hypothetical protein BD413DRAFT_619235 [Trametes elegans]|nr:hypothetical protein BD413DRAFT_619235 [Trametes elegans]